MSEGAVLVVLVVLLARLDPAVVVLPMAKDRAERVSSDCMS